MLCDVLIYLYDLLTVTENWMIHKKEGKEKTYPEKLAQSGNDGHFLCPCYYVSGFLVSLVLVSLRPN